MPGWIGPTVALSLVVIALCFLGIAASVLLALREAAARSDSLVKELGELRREISPTLQALTRLGEDGAEIAGLAKEEVREVVHMTQRLRKDMERGLQRTRRRLADFEAVVEVVQDEFEETALDVTTALHTVRSSAGMLGQLRRMVMPRRRGRR